MNADPVIALDALAVGYGRQPVLANLSFGIARGSAVGLLGANGSGKTTLLKTIAGILPPVRGRIAFGHPRPVLGYVPQRESIDTAFLLSSLELALMGLCGRVGPGRRPGRADRAWVMACLEKTGASELARTPFSFLSGGQKQRVLIARALAARPDLLLLDEPTAGIDPEATRAVAGLLRGLNRAGLTIVMANHDLPVVRETTGTLLWVRQGRVDCGETAAMLGESPPDPMNLPLA